MHSSLHVHETRVGVAGPASFLVVAYLGGMSKYYV